MAASCWSHALCSNQNLLSSQTSTLYNLAQLISYREPGTGSPNVPIVSSDDGVLDHFGADQLVVHIALPGHDDCVYVLGDVLVSALSSRMNKQTRDHSRQQSTSSGAGLSAPRWD